MQFTLLATLLVVFFELPQVPSVVWSWWRSFTWYCEFFRHSKRSHRSWQIS